MGRAMRGRQALIWTAAAAVLAGVFTLYLKPDLALSLATQLWACF